VTRDELLILAARHKRTDGPSWDINDPFDCMLLESLAMVEASLESDDAEA